VGPHRGVNTPRSPFGVVLTSLSGVVISLPLFVPKRAHISHSEGPARAGPGGLADLFDRATRHHSRDQVAGDGTACADGRRWGVSNRGNAMLISGSPSPKAGMVPPSFARQGGKEARVFRALSTTTAPRRIARRGTVAGFAVLVLLVLAGL